MAVALKLMSGYTGFTYGESSTLDEASTHADGLIRRDIRLLWDEDAIGWFAKSLGYTLHFRPAVDSIRIEQIKDYMQARLSAAWVTTLASFAEETGETREDRGTIITFKIPLDSKENADMVIASLHEELGHENPLPFLSAGQRKQTPLGPGCTP